MKQIHVYKVIQFLAFLMRMCPLFVVVVVVVVVVEIFFAFSSSPTESLDKFQPTLYEHSWAKEIQVFTKEGPHPI